MFDEEPRACPLLPSPASSSSRALGGARDGGGKEGGTRDGDGKVRGREGMEEGEGESSVSLSVCESVCSLVSLSVHSLDSLSVCSFICLSVC